MKKLKSALLISFLIFSCTLVYAQQSLLRFSNEYYKSKALTDINERYVNIEGTPYFNENFLNGELIVKSDQIYIYKAKLRYNIYKDEMEIMDDEENFYIISPPKNLVKIKLHNESFIYSDFIEKNYKGEGYFTMKTDGQYKFLVKKYIVLTEAQKEEPYKKASPARFNDAKDKFFVKKGNSPAQYFRKIKDLKEILPEESKLIDKYLKSNKLKSKDVESWIKLFEYLNNN